MTVRLHIERVVLDGFDLSGAQADHVLAALEAELSARLAEVAPEFWADLALPALKLEQVALPVLAAPEQVGRQAGAALYGGLRP